MQFQSLTESDDSDTSTGQFSSDDSATDFNSANDSVTGVDPTSKQGQSFLTSAGDALLNKSRTRQLIDLELLIISGLTWAFFLLTETIYHHWRTSNGEAHLSQYSYPGGRGEGLITKTAKVFFWGQFALIALVVLVLLT